MSKIVSILTVLLLVITKTQASTNNGCIEEKAGDGNYQYTSKLVTVSTLEQSLEIVDHETGENFTVPSRHGEVILRTLGNIFRFTQHHNFAGTYNAIEVFRDRRFNTIDLGGGNKYRLSQACIQDDMLFLTMLDGTVYSYHNDRVEAFSVAHP